MAGVASFVGKSLDGLQMLPALAGTEPQPRYSGMGSVQNALLRPEEMASLLTRSKSTEERLKEMQERMEVSGHGMRRQMEC